MIRSSRIPSDADAFLFFLFSSDFFQKGAHFTKAVVMLLLYQVSCRRKIAGQSNTLRSCVRVVQS